MAGITLEVSGVRLTLEDVGGFAALYDEEVQKHRQTISVLAAIKDGRIPLSRLAVDEAHASYVVLPDAATAAVAEAPAAPLPAPAGELNEYGCDASCPVCGPAEFVVEVGAGP